ncbi:MAG: hypothetical protein IT280_13230 [Ignavibacteria bacterium]|nr:hypothetical protein [Ignavibacteria bacterium]
MDRKKTRKKYRIKINLSQTTLTDYNSGVAQDRIFFIPQDQSHLLILSGEQIFTREGNGILIKIYQN